MSRRSYHGRHRAPQGRLRTALGHWVPAVAAGALLLTSTGASPEAAIALTDSPAAAASAAHPPPAVAGPHLPDRAESGRRAARSADRAALTVAVTRIEQVQDAQRETARREARRAREVREAEREREAAQAREAERLAASRAWVSPMSTMHFTSGFGYRWGRLHAGADFSTPVGTPVRAMSSGTVTRVTYTSTSGNRVEIEYWDGTMSYYFHLSARAAVPGETVSPGEVVGYSGNTGRSTGPHLHLEIHPGGGGPINPLPWLADHGLA